MLAFTPSYIPSIMDSVDFLNIMTYDLMNRRDNVTKHHTGIENSLEAIDAYITAGVEPSKANLGLAFYVKWFKTDAAARQECEAHPVGCPAALMEDPETGADLGKAGAFSWHDDVPAELRVSFDKARKEGTYDKDGYFYFDVEEDLFWSFDTPDAIRRKVTQIRKKRAIGGVFAWGLGEDAPKFINLKAANKAVQLWRNGRVDRSEL
jgi:GH18 family chitinase